MKRIITLVLAIALIPMTYSCGESKAEKAARIEQEKKAAEERVERERKEFEQKTFSTHAGTFYINDALEHCYAKGVDHGFKYGNENPRFTQLFGSEEAFKIFFKAQYGIPTDEKAKEVYKQGYAKFKQGWEYGKNSYKSL